MSCLCSAHRYKQEGCRTCAVVITKSNGLLPEGAKEVKCSNCSFDYYWYENSRNCPKCWKEKEV